MNTKRLYEIIAETTCQLRKGAEVEEHVTDSGLHVKEIYGMPHESEARPDIEKVDVEFIVIGVDRNKAESRKDELISILREYPHPERLADGPSYIEVGGEIGDQGAAFQLFALGKVLKLWDIVTPARMGFTGEMARTLAGQGMVMMTGYKVAA